MTPAERSAISRLSRAFGGVTIVQDPPLWISDDHLRRWNTLSARLDGSKRRMAGKRARRL